MKNLLLIFLLLASGINTYSQEKIEYCELVGGGIMPFHLSVKIYLGANNIVDGKKQPYLKNKEGKDITFKSMIDAMNYMSQDGWEFVNSYELIEKNETYQLRWIIKKKY